jgi:hypothetical protein
LFITFLPALAAIVLAIVALTRIGRSAGARTGRPLAVIGAVLGALSIVVGIAVVVAITSSGVFSGHIVGYSSLESGDCFNLPSGFVSLYHTYPCSYAHDAEVFGRTFDPAPPGAPYPGGTRLTAEARLTCAGELRIYVTTTFDLSRYREQFLYPLSAGWGNGQRTIICGLRSADGSKLTGSIRSGTVA